MSRLQLALNVSNLDEAITFYRRIFGVSPAKHRPGYANFAIANPPLKLVLFENPASSGTLNHLGVELESADEVSAERDRLVTAGLSPNPESRTTCCYADQTKTYAIDPDGLAWELYAVLEDSPKFGNTSCCEPTSCCPS